MDSGYRYCQCRDCLELLIGNPGDYCEDCIEAGCPDYKGHPGMSQECQRQPEIEIYEREVTSDSR